MSFMSFMVLQFPRNTGGAPPAKKRTQQRTIWVASTLVPTPPTPTIHHAVYFAIAAKFDLTDSFIWYMLIITHVDYGARCDPRASKLTLYMKSETR